jgi:hypothetical protein
MPRPMGVLLPLRFSGSTSPTGEFGSLRSGKPRDRKRRATPGRPRRVRLVRGVRLDPRDRRVRSLRRLAGPAGFVWFVGFVRIPGSAGFVRIFPRPGTVGPPGSFGFRRSLGSSAPPTGRLRWVRSARRVCPDARSRRVRSGTRAVGSGGAAGFVRSADLPVWSGSFGGLGACRRSGRPVPIGAKAARRAGQPSAAIAPRHLGRRASTDALERTSTTISALPLGHCPGTANSSHRPRRAI